MLTGEIHICYRFFDSILYLILQLWTILLFTVFSYLKYFLPGSFFAFLGMDCFQHESYRFHLVARCNGEDVSVEMYGTSLISGIRENFRNSFQHPQIFITDDQTYTGKPAFLQPYKERTPALTILFHAFCSAKNFAAAILTDADCN